MVKLFGRVIMSLQRPLLTQDNATYKQNTNIHILKGIQTHYPSKQAAKTYALDRAATGTSEHVQ
jgi:hypothetical protein